MAATSENVTNLIETFKEVFNGVSEFRWKDGDVSTASLTTVKWDKVLPVMDDGMDFKQADPSITSSNVLGLSKPWASVAKAGDVNCTITIPSVADGVLGWLYTKGTTAITTAEELINGESGTFKGYGYKLVKKVVEGTVMIISEDGKYALIIRHLRGYTSFDYSKPNSAPFAVKLTTTLSGDVATADATDDFDLALLKWEKSA